MGSLPAFEVLVARYRRSLVRYCERLLGEGDAEDAVQETFMRAHAAIVGGEQVRMLGAWLYSIAHNVCVSALRSRAARPGPPAADLAAHGALDETAEQRQDLREVLATVSSLPRRQRDAIVLQALEGRSYDEIARALGASRGAVAQLLNRARMSVRERLGAMLPLEQLVRVIANVTSASPATTISCAGALSARLCAAVLVPATVTGMGVAGGAARLPLHSQSARRFGAPARAGGPVAGTPAVRAALVRARASIRSKPGHTVSRPRQQPPRPAREASSPQPGPPLPQPARGPAPSPGQPPAGASRTGNDFSWFMNGDSTMAGRPSSAMPGNRDSVSSNMMRSSSRASAAPRQK